MTLFWSLKDNDADLVLTNSLNRRSEKLQLYSLKPFFLFPPVRVALCRDSQSVGEEGRDRQTH